MNELFTALLMSAIAFLIPLAYIAIMSAVCNPFVQKEAK